MLLGRNIVFNRLKIEGEESVRYVDMIKVDDCDDGTVKIAATILFFFAFMRMR